MNTDINKIQKFSYISHLKLIILKIFLYLHIKLTIILEQLTENCIILVSYIFSLLAYF